MSKPGAPWAHELPRTKGELLSRLQAVPLLHRLVPRRVAVALALLRGTIEWWLLPRRRRWALAGARDVAPDGSSVRDVRRLSRAQLRERCVQTELSWRPWDAARMPIEGLDRLLATRAQGGVLVALLHVGPMYSLFHALAAQGVRASIVTAARPGEERFTGSAGHWMRTQLELLEAAGHRLVPRGDAYAQVAELLREGEVCCLAWDVPGPQAVELLGRPAAVRTGIARLALETGAPILPAFTVRDGLRQHAVIEAPVAGVIAGGEAELTVELAARMNAILAAHRAQIQIRRQLSIFSAAAAPPPLTGSTR
ncbi:MAG: hypothetical protein F2832_00835 [Actinobacteria bacterium]|nr:hypothetical protein [Actinomycetota bacterium]